MKRVLFISSQPFFQWRGTPIRIAFDVQALAELGYAVDLLTLPVGRDKAVPGVNVIRVPNLFGVRSVSIGPSLVKAAFDVLLLFRALRLARRGRYDVIHGVEDGAAVGAVAAGLSGSRLVFEKHSDPSSYRKGILRNLVMSLYAKVERATARRADAVIGTGAGLVRQVRDMGIDGSVHHIFDIPSSLVDASPERTADIRAKLRDGGDGLLVTYVGSFAVYQGVDMLFESMPAVVSRHPDTRFVIVGGAPREITERKAWLAARGIAPSVVFPGKIPPDDLPDYLAASDVLLCPRVSGVNTPLKLLDYMKAGRAIVATDVEANRLLLDASVAELVQATPGSFAEGLCRVLDDGERRAALGLAARRLIDERYNYEEFKRRLGACYAEVIEGR